MTARRRIPWLRLLVVAAAVVAAFAPTPPSWVERYYSRGVYPIIQRMVTPAGNTVGVALFDVALAAAAAGLLAWWIVRLRRAGPGRRARTLASLVAHTVVLAAAAYVVFLGTWGLNYRRERLRDTVGMEPGRVTRAALRELAETSVAAINGLHEPANQTPWLSLADLRGSLAPPLGEAVRRLGGGPAPAMGRPKASWMTWYFRRAAIDGMINPFFLEILVNDRVLPFERPFVVAHESAHLAGYADEGEASFVGWLACVSGEVQMRYSGWLFLLPHTLRYLDEPARLEVFERLDPGPRQDLAAIAARLRDAVPLVSRNARRAYDQFLKANRVEEGIESYGTVVDLVLGTGAWRNK